MASDGNGLAHVLPPSHFGQLNEDGPFPVGAAAPSPANQDRPPSTPRVSGHEIDHVSMEAAMGPGPAAAAAAAAQPKVLVVDYQADNLLAMTAVLDWRR